MEFLDLLKRQDNNSTANNNNNNNNGSNQSRQGDGQGLPQLWIFLLIVLAVLLTLVMSTSFVMHMLQRRQRTLLSRRIANGEVDLELLGLKRLNVPQEQIDKMSQYVWSADPAVEEVKRPAPAAGSTHRHSTMFGQTVCPICLDDFVDGETQVRELPCNHIFHPECIDPFLLNNSSLCPVCKKSSLPPGFCPVEVTNVMVRRERLGRNMRRNRDRMQASRSRTQRHGVPTVIVTSSTSVNNNTTDAAPTPPETSNQDTELGVIESRAPDTAEPPPEVASQGQAARRAWRRDRVASQHIREFEQHGEASREAEAKRPLWRRMFGLN